MKIRSLEPHCQIQQPIFHQLIFPWYFCWRYLKRCHKFQDFLCDLVWIRSKLLEQLWSAMAKALKESSTETDNEELLGLLQVDGKGWNVNIFNDNVTIQACLCYQCGNVCKDASELGLSLIHI